jgi:hypothetical protein
MQHRLTNSDQLQLVILRPVDQPRRKRVHGASINLVHQGNVPVSTRTRLRELLLALLRCLVIPVSRVNVVRNNAISERLHGGEHVAASGQVGWAHVRGLLADNVDESLLEARHLAGEVGCGHGAKVLRVRPGVRGDLVTGFVRVLESGLLAVDAA